MNTSCKSSNALLVGAISGLVVGAGVALLFAPGSGKETRGKLRKRFEEMRGRFNEMRQRQTEST